MQVSTSQKSVFFTVTTVETKDVIKLSRFANEESCVLLFPLLPA